MPRKPAIRHEDLLALLDYQPATGLFTWRQDRRPRVKASDEAGGIKGKWNYYVITIKGRSYPAHQLAWFYVHGVWPEGSPIFLDGNTDNCAIGNLKFARPTYSEEPRAIAARAYRAKTKNIVAARKDESPIADIRKNILTGKWDVHIPGTPDNAATYSIARLDDAIRAYLAHVEGLKTLERLPPRLIDEKDLYTYAGNVGAVSLSEAIGWVCYDPDSGRFYNRMRHSHAIQPGHLPRPVSNSLVAGTRADVLTDIGKSYVLKFFGRDYQAHMFAVFLQEGYWPKRRSVKHLDGNGKNNRWANLKVEIVE